MAENNQTDQKIKKRMLFVTSYWCCYFHLFLQPKSCNHVMNDSLLRLVDVCEYLKTTKLMWMLTVGRGFTRRRRRRRRWCLANNLWSVNRRVYSHVSGSGCFKLSVSHLQNMTLCLPLARIQNPWGHFGWSSQPHKPVCGLSLDFRVGLRLNLGSGAKTEWLGLRSRVTDSA